LFTEPFDFEDEKSDRIMSSLEKGMRVRDEILQSTGRHLGDGLRGWDTDPHEELRMRTLGAALEEIVFEDSDDEPETGIVHGTDT